MKGEGEASFERRLRLDGDAADVDMGRSTRVIRAALNPNEASFVSRLRVAPAQV